LPPPCFSSFCLFDCSSVTSVFFAFSSLTYDKGWVYGNLGLSATVVLPIMFRYFTEILILYIHIHVHSVFFENAGMRLPSQECTALHENTTGLRYAIKIRSIYPEYLGQNVTFFRYYVSKLNYYRTLYLHCVRHIATIWRAWHSDTWLIVSKMVAGEVQIFNLINRLFTSWIRRGVQMHLDSFLSTPRDQYSPILSNPSQLNSVNSYKYLCIMIAGHH